MVWVQAFRALVTISCTASTSKPQVLHSHPAENTLLFTATGNTEDGTVSPEDHTNIGVARMTAQFKTDRPVLIHCLCE